MATAIFWHGCKYYLYDIYDTWRDAYNEARRWKRENGSRYFIEPVKVTSIFNYKVYKLYLSKARRLF